MLFLKMSKKAPARLLKLGRDSGERRSADIMEDEPLGIALVRLVFLTESMPEAVVNFASLVPSALEMLPTTHAEWLSPMTRLLA
mmetsp:Transcript_4386/g.12972  ORF Transcript_4386/g.12972 Transcript_4386/m.12972 type:complete len:84 (+) Transcript_4386:873-1124(+)